MKVRGRVGVLYRVTVRKKGQQMFIGAINVGVFSWIVDGHFGILVSCHDFSGKGERLERKEEGRVVLLNPLEV